MMSKEQVTAEAVTKAVLHRITTGQYVPGDRLPPVRKLAEEIGSNRNTVNKAYQMLFELGIIEYSDSRHRAYVVKSSKPAGSKTKSELLDYFHQHSVELVWQGMAAGMTSDEMLEQLNSAVTEVFGQSELDLIFYECNDYDTNEMGRQLNDVLQMRVEYKNLNHFYKNPAAVFNKYDLIITTYHHLAEISAAIQQSPHPPEKVVGIDTRLTADSMLKIARLSGPDIGVVCTNQNTAHMLKHILFGYHPEWNIDAASLEDDPDSVKKLIQKANHLVVTLTCAEQVQELTGHTPDVIVNFQIDEQSIAFLNQRIHAIRLAKNQAR
jgi:DNA-binding transcriptional regulator YhcF (GntR family)/galactitol-specific phosphotransferase system IIB component